MDRDRNGGRLVDVSIAGGVLLTDLVAQVAVTAGEDWRSPPLGVAGVVLAVAGTAPLLMRRRRPLAVLLLLGLAAGVASSIAPPGLLTQQLGVTLVIGVYTVAAWSNHRRWSAVIAAAVLAAVVAGAIGDGTPTIEAVLAGVAVVGLPWAIGFGAHTRRLYVEAVEQRLVAAERDRDVLARQAVADERNRIARELHDVVAHHVSLIGVQAGAARTTLPPGADATRTALAAIEASSRDAVREMGQLLDVLHPRDDPMEMAPAPGLARIGDLAAGFRAAGIDVDTTVSVPNGGLDPLLAVCCYRVVEEALTNVARHSAANTAAVSVCAGGGGVRIAVRDPGPDKLAPPGPPRSGRGLVGMAERVALFGGHLDAGRQPEGGFAVVAVVPRSPTS